MNNIENYNYQTFEDIKDIDESEQEFWFARELQEVLGYTEWRNFLKIIDKSKVACFNSGFDIEDHFVDANKMVKIGSSTKRIIDDIILSRYACYLIVMNGDPRKSIIAAGQTYFAVKTRQQELVENYDQLSEEQKRLAIRNEIINHNKSLAEAAQMAGVETSQEYAIFQNNGYKGLYGGLGMRGIHERKGLKKNHKILDYMGSTELAANLFRATQTDEKLRNNNIIGKQAAYKIHYEVGAKVRKTIEELGGTMPENLPTPEKSIKKIEQENKKKKLPKK